VVLLLYLCAQDFDIQSSFLCDTIFAPMKNRSMSCEIGQSLSDHRAFLNVYCLAFCCCCIVPTLFVKITDSSFRDTSVRRSASHLEGLEAQIKRSFKSSEVMPTLSIVVL
jgi:hypothetical protein